MAKKQTSSRVSTLAAKLMRQVKGADPNETFAITVRSLRKLCASLISQDETRGNPKPKKRARKGRKA